MGRLYISLCYMHTGIRVRYRQVRVPWGVNFVRKNCESSNRQVIYACQYFNYLVGTVCSQGYISRIFKLEDYLMSLGRFQSIPADGLTTGGEGVQIEV